MKEKNFLLKVLGLSGIPRAFTFLLTLASFPFMLSKVGASDYGIIVFLTSIIAVFESFADFGVSSAAGKEIAFARVTKKSILGSEIKAWARFQFKAAILGLIPMTIGTFYLAAQSKEFIIPFDIIIISLLTSWITIALNFTRSILTATLMFKSLAFLDITESVGRSIAFFLIALTLPTAKGVVMGLFIVIVISASIAVIIMTRLIKRAKLDSENIIPEDVQNLSNTKSMFSESLHFLWLRLVTRIFTGIPMFILGRQFSSDIVGIVGTVQRMVDLLTFPFAVLGNALAARGKEMIDLGIKAVNNLWATISRLLSLAFLLWTIIILGSPWFSDLLFIQESPDQLTIRMLTILVISSSISVLINPISDYVGAIRKRNILLSIMCIIQILLMVLGNQLFGSNGAIAGFVLTLLLINIGYLRIGVKAFYPDSKYLIHSEIIYFLFAILVSASSVFVGGELLLGNLNLTTAQFSQVLISSFSVMLVLFVLANKRTKVFYINRLFLEFHPSVVE